MVAQSESYHILFPRKDYHHLRSPQTGFNRDLQQSLKVRNGWKTFVHSFSNFICTCRHLFRLRTSFNLELHRHSAVPMFYAPLEGRLSTKHSLTTQLHQVRGVPWVYSHRWDIEMVECSIWNSLWSPESQQFDRKLGLNASFWHLSCRFGSYILARVNFSLLLQLQRIQYIPKRSQNAVLQHNHQVLPNCHAKNNSRKFNNSLIVERPGTTGSLGHFDVESDCPVTFCFRTHHLSS